MFSFLFGGSRTRTKSKKTKCPPGEILRNSYHRKGYRKTNGTYVKSKTLKTGCIKDQGKPGKGPKIVPPVKHPGSLKKYGYALNKNVKDREGALKKAVKAFGANEVIRKLNYIRILNKSKKTSYGKYTRDMKFVQDMKKMEGGYEKKKKVVGRKLKSILKKKTNK
jgi:hypothetical protein